MLVTHEVVDEFMKILREWISKKLFDFGAYSDHDSSGILHGNLPLRTRQHRSSYFIDIHNIVRRTSSALTSDLLLIFYIYFISNISLALTEGCSLRALLVLNVDQRISVVEWVLNAACGKDRSQKNLSKNDTVVSQRI